MAPHGVVAGPAILDLADRGVLHSRSLGRGCPLRFGWSCASCVGADALTRGEWCALRGNGAAETRYWGSLGRLRLAGMFRIQGESSGRSDQGVPGTACFGRQLSPFPRTKGRQEQHSADRGSGSRERTWNRLRKLFSRVGRPAEQTLRSAALVPEVIRQGMAAWVVENRQVSA
jgi:hypothetical protein